MAKQGSQALRVLFENDRVRVLDVRLKPGEKAPTHAHPSSHLIYPFNSSKVHFALPDGTAQEVEFEAGQVRWFEATTHAVENVGQSEDHVLVVEVK